MASEKTLALEIIVKSIPAGKVTTYGAIAERAGLRNGARQVVRLLHARAEKENLPWHRVLRKDGSLALPEGGGRELQQALLEGEGVAVSTGGMVDLAIYGWK